ncbi:dynactin subunit 1 [Drosophila albomicans]|uniref:Dynactin subunit 1 n=1 Tax=Drosophila albomicans TaxID=7291 RepID=A0A6P8X183_DROAB|nr:dynactin subunit 1 [Drosophila albomicans]
MNMSTAQPKLGQRVQVTGKNQLGQSVGRVAYVGRTKFAGGQWFGVVLDEPRGKNNGTVNGSTYFKCAPNCGIFVRAQHLQLLGLQHTEQQQQQQQQTKVKYKKQQQLENNICDNNNDIMQRDVSKVRLSSSSSSRSRSNSRQASSDEQDNSREASGSSGGRALRKLPEKSTFALTTSKTWVTSTQPSAQSQSKRLRDTLETHQESKVTTIEAKNITQGAAATSVTKATATAVGNATLTAVTTTTDSSIPRAVTALNAQTTPTTAAVSETATVSSATAPATATATSVTSAASTASITASTATTALIAPTTATTTVANAPNSTQMAAQATAEVATPATKTLVAVDSTVVAAQPSTLRAPPLTCNQRRSTSYTQLRPTRISQPKPTTAQAQSSTAQLTLAMPVPVALAPKRSKTSMSPTSSGSVKRVTPAAFVEPGFLEILRPQFTLGPALRTPSTVAPPVDNPEQRQLREELQLLRVQKSEDKLKLLELECIKIHNEQLQEFKSQIMQQQVLLQRELQRCRHEQREAQETALKYKRELDDVAESIELLTLDKEMAEERLETLQMEMEMAQERNDELSLDLEILRAEQEEHNEGQHLAKNEKQSTNVTTLQTTGEFLRLEQYNQRLRETVVRLRDTLAHEKQLAQRTHKDLETKHSEINELKSIKELQSRRVDQMELQMMDLKEQVDASLGAESMVTQLATLKLELEERVKLLEDEVNELEALEQIQEQLIESNQELESDLRDEIDKLSGQVKSLEQQKNAALESLYDRDVTILKFRDLVRQLQEQLQLKTDGGTLSIEDFSSANESQQEETSQQSQADYQHIFSVSKAYGRALEQQLKAVELRLQGQHLEHVLAFVPEQFLLRGGEHDVVLVMLLLERMNDKLEIVCQAINEKFPNACEFGRDAIFEGYSVQRYIFRAQCIYLLKSLQLVLQQFRHGLNHCDYELCTHAAIYRSDLELQEQQLDEFVRLLKTGQLDEHTNCEPIRRVLHYINGLHQNLMPPQTLVELLDEQQLYNALIEVYEAGMDAVNANAGLLHTIIQLGDEQTASFHCMQLLMEHSCALKQKLKKLQRKMSGNKTAAAWTGMQCARYQRILEANEALGALISMLGISAREASKESNGGIAHEKLWRILCLNYTKFAPNQEAEQRELDVYSQRCMQLLEEQLEELLTLLEPRDVNTEYVRHAAFNTLQQRAAQVKRHYEDVKCLELTVAEREKEIKALKLAAKMKQQDYSEMQVRKEMAEKQLHRLSQDHCQTLTQLAEGVEQLEQCFLSKEATLQHALDTLTEKLNSLEQAQQHWQQQQQVDSACVTSSTRSSNRELNLMHQALRQERQIRVKLQGSELCRSFAALEPLHVPQPESSSQLTSLEAQLHGLKNQWLLAQLELGESAQQRRSHIELQGSRLLRHIFHAYCSRHPHRAAPTDFGLFISGDLRRAF